MRPGLYRAACAALMGPKGGDLIDHDPDSADDNPADKLERLRRTKVAYGFLFGEKPLGNIWAYAPGHMAVFFKDLQLKHFKCLVNPEDTVGTLKLRHQVNLPSLF